MPARTRLILAALAAALTVANSARAGLIILGNLPAINDASVAVIDGGVGPDSGGNRLRKAVSFTMPAADYPVLHVELRLGQYNTAIGDVAAVGFYRDNDNDEPGELVHSLLSNPSSSSDDIGSFIFTPSTPLTLSANTKYWLQVGATAGNFAWRASSPFGAPTSEIEATFGRQRGFRNDEPVDILDGFVSNFQVLTSVPEPGSFCGLAMLGVVVLAHRPIQNRLCTRRCQSATQPQSNKRFV